MKEYLKCQKCGYEGPGVALYWVGGQGYIASCVGDHQKSLDERRQLADLKSMREADSNYHESTIPRTPKGR